VLHRIYNCSFYLKTVAVAAGSWNGLFICCSSSILLCSEYECI